MAISFLYFILKIFPVLTIIAERNLFPPEKTPYFIDKVRPDLLFFSENNFTKKIFVSLAILSNFFKNFFTNFLIFGINLFFVFKVRISNFF